MAFSLQNEKLQSFLLNMQLATVKVLLLYAWGRHRYLLLYFIFPVMRTSEVMTHWLGCRSFFFFLSFFDWVICPGLQFTPLIIITYSKILGEQEHRLPRQQNPHAALWWLLQTVTCTLYYNTTNILDKNDSVLISGLMYHLVGIGWQAILYICIHLLKSVIEVV